MANSMHLIHIAKNKFIMIIKEYSTGYFTGYLDLTSHHKPKSVNKLSYIIQ